jgi:glycogen synthase
MMKVLFLPKWYPNKNDNTEGIFIRRHAEAVAMQEVKVLVLYATALNQDFRGLYFSEKREENQIVELKYYYKKHLTGVGILDRAIKMLLYFWCCTLGYLQLKSEFGRPDICHVHVLLRTGISARFVQLFDKIPFVYTEHWSGYHPEDGDYKGRIRVLLTNWVLKKAMCIIPVSKHLAIAMQRHQIKGKYVVTPNVVDVQSFVPKFTPTNNNPKIAIHISNFDKRAKNVQGILKVMTLLDKKRDDVILWIVGDSPERPELEHEATKLGILKKNVFFLGKKTGQSLIELIQQSDFLFMFSNFENQPCVVMEAMACGKPVLATYVGGIPEMVNEERGILSEPGNLEMMVMKLEEMLTKLDSFDAQKIISFARDHYSYQQVGKQIVSLYKQGLQSA